MLSIAKLASRFRWVHFIGTQVIFGLAILIAAVIATVPIAFLSLENTVDIALIVGSTSTDSDTSVKTNPGKGRAK